MTKKIILSDGTNCEVRNIGGSEGLCEIVTKSDNEKDDRRLVFCGITKIDSFPYPSEIKGFLMEGAEFFNDPDAVKQAKLARRYFKDVGIYA